MRWAETVASGCRYAECAERIWGDWDILWEESEAEYQGYARFLATKDGKFSVYEYTYGSCSACDSWEDSGMSGMQIEDEMRRTAMWFDNRETLHNWLDMLEGKLDIPEGMTKDEFLDAQKAARLLVGEDIEDSIRKKCALIRAALKT